jgi:ABC-type sugar transport system ATPase subunit
MTSVVESQEGAVVTLSDLHKRYGQTQALAGADLIVKGGTIHALVGENGAGKSTALGALAGRLGVHSGTINIRGEDVKKITPRVARAHGVAAIYQELTIVPTLTAMQNVYLGQTPARLGFMANPRMRKGYRALCARLRVTIPPHALAGTLPVGDQQMLEIMRALESGADILLFDEPTSALVQTERENLFRLMHELKSHGVTMVLVSHNLDEVLAHSDEVTVFRNGTNVATGPASRWTKQTLVAEMLGRAAPDLLASHRAKRAIPPTDVLQITALNVPGLLHDVHMSARSGEVLGVAGLMGSGRTTLLRTIAGLERTAEGELVVDGKAVSWPRSARAALGLGISLVPEDRKLQGLMLPMSSIENVGIASLSEFSDFGFVRRGQMAKAIGEVAEDYAIDRLRLGQPVRNLSGGNQQKVLLARWRLKNPRVFLADEPTRGIDVGAKAAILEALREFADRGATVIVVSSELEELTVVADRVVVMHQGQLVQEIDAGENGAQVDRMLAAAFGH